MRAKITRGSHMPGLIRYLVGPGKFNEHTNPHVVAGSGTLARFALPSADGTTRILNRDDARVIAAELDEPHDVHGVKVAWTDPKKKKAAEDRIKKGELLPGMTPKEQKAWVRAQSRLPDAYVWQCSLNLRADELPPGDDAWSKIVTDFMREMGFDTERDAAVNWVAIHHGTSKNGNDHIHIAADLVRADGSIVDLFWERDKSDPRKKIGDGPRSHRVVQELERKHGLQIDRDEGAGTPSYHHAEVKMAEELYGREEPVRAELMRRVRAYSTAAGGEAAFVARLADDPQMLAFPRFEDGTVKGYSVALVPPGMSKAEAIASGKVVKQSGTNLGRDLSLGQLRRSWGESTSGMATARRRWRLVADNPDGAARAIAAENAPTDVDLPPVPGGPATSEERTGRARLPYARMGEDGETSRKSPRPATVPDSEDADQLLRARADLAGWTSYVRAIPTDDTEQIARAASMTSGVFAAWSITVEKEGPGPLAHASNTLARTASRKYTAARPIQRRRASPMNAAALLMLTSPNTDPAMAWTIVMMQLLEAVQALADAQEAAGNAAAARRLTALRAEQVGALEARLGHDGVPMPPEPHRPWRGDLSPTVGTDEHTATDDVRRAPAAAPTPVTPEEILHPAAAPMEAPRKPRTTLPYRRPDDERDRRGGGQER